MNQNCDFCTDLRYITPAKYLHIEGNPKFIQDAKKLKQFIMEDSENFTIVDHCPKCGYKFTEEDYDNFW